MKEFYKNHILDLVLAILCLILGIVLLPFTGIGKTILDYIVALVLLVYLFTYLVKKLAHTTGSILVLTVVEFVVILLIALGLILKQLEVFTIGETRQIIGLVIWLRGVVCLVRGYFVSTAEARRRYSLLLFLGYIALVTLGAYFLFGASFISDAELILILSVTAFVAFALFLVLAIKFWPKKTEAEKKEAQRKKQEREAEKKKKADEKAKKQADAERKAREKADKKSEKQEEKQALKETAKDLDKKK